MLTSPPVSLQQQDCLAFLRSLPDASVDVITTDPAYSGMNQHLKLGRGRIVGHYSGKDNDRWFREFQDDPETYRTFLAECARVLKSDRHLYLMFDSFSLLTLGAIVREYFEVKNLIVWDKRAIGMGHYFRRRHEHVVFACKGSRKLNRKDIPDIWTFRRLIRAPYPTQKPVELFEAMLAGSTEPGFVVCDPFAGSGASAIAALRWGCHFVGADVSERAVQFATERIERYLATGIDPAQTPLGDRPAFLGPLTSIRREP